MHCDEVRRELGALKGDRHLDSALLAEHLASCPACAGWADRADRLDRLWEATRPPEPSPEVWDAVWANLAGSLHLSVGTDVRSFVEPVVSPNGSSVQIDIKRKRVWSDGSADSQRSWSWKAIALVGLAQAAVVFLAVGLTWHFSSSKGSHATQIAQAAQRATSGPVAHVTEGAAGPVKAVPVEIDEGHLVVIRAEGIAAKVVDLTPEEAPYGVDDWYVMYNAVESMANPVVAMKE
jgi:hypothetical protein